MQYSTTACSMQGFSSFVFLFFSNLYKHFWKDGTDSVHPTSQLETQKGKSRFCELLPKTHVIPSDQRESRDLTEYPQFF